MLRLLLTPRWVGATVLLIVWVAVCGALGVWQYDRAHQRAHVVAAGREPAVPLPDVLANQPSGVPFPAGLLVRGTGRYGTPTTRVDGTVVTPLVLDGDSGTVAVVRGRAVKRRAAARDVPVSADVVITARMQPPAGPPATSLDRAGLTAAGEDARGYLVLVDQQPTDTAPLTAVASPLPPPHKSGIRLQNAFYAVQWWVFAGFGVFVWVRFLRDDLRDARRDDPRDLDAPAPA